MVLEVTNSNTQSYIIIIIIIIIIITTTTTLSTYLDTIPKN